MIADEAGDARVDQGLEVYIGDGGERRVEDVNGCWPGRGEVAVEED